MLNCASTTVIVSVTFMKGSERERKTKIVPCSLSIITSEKQLYYIITRHEKLAFTKPGGLFVTLVLSSYDLCFQQPPIISFLEFLKRILKE